MEIGERPLELTFLRQKRLKVWVEQAVQRERGTRQDSSLTDAVAALVARTTL
jgi:hypothetical protein